MADSFFAQSWYRVAGLKPRLAGHVAVTRHRYGGQAWYALSDPLSGRVHRVTPSAYLFAARLDGARTVDAVWQEMVAELDTEAPGQDAVIELLMQLHSADLLAGDIPPDAAELLTRRDRLSRALWLRNLKAPLAVQIPLLDPDRFLARTLPLVAPLFGRVALVLWLLLMIAAGAVVLQHWEALTDNLLDRVMAAEGLLALALVYPVMKVLHELGHGYAAKRFGCTVPAMGAMLLVFFPVPYVDASASAALRSKWQRAGVAAAGILVEVTLSAIAALVWAAAEPGLLRAIAFNVMVVGGLSTILVNGNPLLRFDGYYVLSDLIEVPNLAQRGPRYLTWLLDRFVFRVPGLRPFDGQPHERVAMLLHTPLSWVYRLTVTIGIALFVAAHYFVVGVVLGVVSVAVGFVKPVVKGLWQVATGPRYRLVRGRAAGLTFGSIAAVSALLLTVPAPIHATSEGVIWVPQDSFIRAGTDGFVRSVAVAPGTPVTAGTALMQLEHPIAEAKLRVGEARVQELEARYTAEFVTDRIAAEVTRFELAQERAALARERVRIGQQTILAPAEGRFASTRPVEDLPGRYVAAGEVLGYVTPTQGRVARVVVPQADIELVQHRLRDVQIRLADRRTDMISTVVRAVPGAGQQLPSAALATAHGGSIAVDPRDGREPKAFERHFQFDVLLPEDQGGDALAASGFGSRVFVRFDFAWEPVAAMIYRRVRQGLLGRFQV